MADMESNTFFSDDTEEEASYGVLNWNNTQQGRRLSVQTLEKLAVLTDEGGVEGLFLSADDSWFVARKMVRFFLLSCLLHSALDPYTVESKP